MMTMIRRSDKLGQSTHREGRLHDLSRERTDDRASTQADSAQPRPVSGAGPGTGHQRRHGGDVATAHRGGRPLQPPSTPDQAFPPEVAPLLGWLRKDWLLDLGTVWLALRQTVFPQLS